MLLHRERGHASPCSLELPPSIIQIDNRRLHLVADGFSIGASPQRPQQAVGRRYVDPGLEQARSDQPQPLEAVDELILKIPDFRLSGPSLGEDITLSPTVPPIDLHHSIRPNTTDDFAPGYVKT